MELKRLHVAFQLKSLSEAGEFEGYGSVFGVKDHGLDIVVPGAFTKSLAGWAAKGKLPPVLWQHKIAEPIGPHIEMREDAHGLYVKGRLLVEDDQLARRAHAHMKAGSVTGLSIGYELVDYEWDRDKGAYLLKEIELWEVSVVTFAMNEAAGVTAVKSALARGELPSVQSVERALCSVGLTIDQAKGVLSKGYAALQQSSDKGAALVALKGLIDRIPV